MEPWLQKPKQRTVHPASANYKDNRTQLTTKNSRINSSKQRNVTPVCTNYKDNRNQLTLSNLNNHPRENVRMFNKLCPTARIPHAYGSHLKYGVFQKESNSTQPLSAPTVNRILSTCSRSDDSYDMDPDDEPSNVPIVVISPRPGRRVLSHLTLSKVMHVDIKPPVKHVVKSAVQSNKWQ